MRYRIFLFMQKTSEGFRERDCIDSGSEVVIYFKHVKSWLFYYFLLSKICFCLNFLFWQFVVNVRKKRWISLLICVIVLTFKIQWKSILWHLSVFLQKISLQTCCFTYTSLVWTFFSLLVCAGEHFRCWIAQKWWGH